METSAHDKPATGYPLPQSTPAVGYPTGTVFCAAPPSSFYHQQQPTPSTYYTPSLPHPFASTYLSRFLPPVAGVFIVALIMFIMWLVDEPRFPEFRVVSASFNSLNATDSNLISAQLDVTFVATNHHKLDLYYDNVTARLFYGEHWLLATTRSSPLLQHRRSENTIHVIFAMAEEFVGVDVARGIAGDKARGSVLFGVTVSGWMRFNSSITGSSDDYPWGVACYPLDFDFSTNNCTASLTRALNCQQLTAI